MLFSEYLGCLGRLYACQESGNTQCPNTERCLPLEPVVSQEEPPREPNSASTLTSNFFITKTKELLLCSVSILPSFLSGSTFDGKQLCKEAYMSSSDLQRSLLVPHPTNCSKFFNCQPITFNDSLDWIAHEQHCPPSTGFDSALQICNFIENLPRCVYAKTLLK